MVVIETESRVCNDKTSQNTLNNIIEYLWKKTKIEKFLNIF